jgi:hypothetical protein
MKHYIVVCRDGLRRILTNDPSNWIANASLVDEDHNNVAAREGTVNHNHHLPGWQAPQNADRKTYPPHTPVTA